MKGVLVLVSTILSLNYIQARRKLYILDPNFENEVDEIYQTQVGQFLSQGKIPMSDNRHLCEAVPMCLHSEFNTYTFLTNAEEMKQQVNGILANLETGFESLEFRVKHGVPEIDLKTYFNFFKQETGKSSNANWISLEDYYRIRTRLYQDKASFAFDLPAAKIQSQLKSAVKVYDKLYSDNLSSLNYEKFKKIEALRWLLLSSAVLSRWDTENDNQLGIYDGYRDAEGHDALQLFIHRYRLTMPKVLDYYHMCNGELDLYTLHKGLAHMEVYAINAAIRGKVELVYDLPPIDMAKYSRVNTGWGPEEVPEVEDGIIATQAQIEAAEYRKKLQSQEAQKKRAEQLRQQQLQRERIEREEKDRIQKQQEQQKEQIRLQMKRERERQQELQKIAEEKRAAAILAAKLAFEKQRREKIEQRRRAERRKLEQQRAQQRRQEQQRRSQARQRKLRERQSQRQLERVQKTQVYQRRVPSIVSASATMTVQSDEPVKCNKNFHEAGISSAEKRRRMICAFS